MGCFDTGHSTPKPKKKSAEVYVCKVPLMVQRTNFFEVIVKVPPCTVYEAKHWADFIALLNAHA